MNKMDIKTNTNPLISICIPTYNRKNLLGEALDAILSQVNEGNTTEIELVISDNASPDGTADLVQSKIHAYPQARVIYTSQATNVGPDRNILDVMFKGTGPFVLVLSDDDLLLPGALDAILMHLRGHPALDALVLNSYGFSTDVEMGPTCYNLDSDRLIHDRGESIVFLGTMITFVSSLVVRRELFHGKDYSDSLGMFFPHSHVFLDVLAHEGGMLVTKDPWLAVRDNASVNYNLYVAFLTGFSKVMQYAEVQGFPLEATRTVLKAHRRWLAGMTTKFVTNGSLGRHRLGRLDAIMRLYDVYGADPYVFTRIVPIILLPVWAARQLAKIYMGIRWCAKLLRGKVHG